MTRYINNSERVMLTFTLNRPIEGLRKFPKSFASSESVLNGPTNLLYLSQLFSISLRTKLSLSRRNFSFASFENRLYLRSVISVLALGGSQILFSPLSSFTPSYD